MDQLIATFGIDWRLLLIQIVNFGIVLAVLTYVLFKPLFKIMDKRREIIAEGVRVADAASAKMLEAQSEAENIIGKGSLEAETIVAAARKRAEIKGDEILKEASRRAESLISEANMRVADMEQSALQESRREIAKAAIIATEKLLRHQQK